ncbi:molecular chaperone [Pseudomonas syringae]|nr:molecular chaperone [Pseudomonas syringae]MBD8790819.1 molecular chaperone [Pseudomonas syringae]MBD8802046.1 molecular chaperone [Pseudomonas syringae]MBD8814612.1 molecular chaperone [Pseudomonas syringae]
MLALPIKPHGVRWIAALCLACAVLVADLRASHAALSISATRVVLASDKRSVALVVSNPSDRPFAVQTWVNTAADDDSSAVPLIATPPLFRLDPGKEQQVQINGLPNDLPHDRESLFYFNVQEIPQAAGDSNVLNIALRTRIKLFYRPASLKDSPMARLPDLQWSIEQVNGQVHLVAHNPSPFHVSFARLEVQGHGKTEQLKAADMLEPLATRRYRLSATRPGAGLAVVYTAINDYGGSSLPITLPIRVSP